MRSVWKRLGLALGLAVGVMSGAALADIAVGVRVVVTAVSDEDMTAKTIEVGIAAPPSAK